MKLSAEHVASVRGSTTTDAAIVAAFLDHALRVQASRVANGAASAMKRSERKREAVLAVIQAKPLLSLRWCGASGAIHDWLEADPKRYRLKGSSDVPCDDLIRDVLQQKIAAITLASSLPPTASAAYASAMSVTTSRSV